MDRRRYCANPARRKICCSSQNSWPSRAARVPAGTLAGYDATRLLYLPVSLVCGLLSDPCRPQPAMTVPMLPSAGCGSRPTAHARQYLAARAPTPLHDTFHCAGFAPVPRRTAPPPHGARRRAGAIGSTQRHVRSTRGEATGSTPPPLAARSGILAVILCDHSHWEGGEGSLRSVARGRGAFLRGVGPFI